MAWKYLTIQHIWTDVEPPIYSDCEWILVFFILEAIAKFGEQLPGTFWQLWLWQELGLRPSWSDEKQIFAQIYTALEKETVDNQF